MTWIIMLLVTAGAAVVQTVLPPWPFLGQAKWPCLLAIVLYYALHHDGGVAIVAALLAGFLQDALSPIPLGYSSAVFAVIAWATGRFRPLVLAESPVTQVLFGFLSGVLVILLFYPLLFRAGLVRCRLTWVLLKALGTGGLAAICTPVAFLAGGTLDGLVGNVDVKEDIEDMVDML